ALPVRPNADVSASPLLASRFGHTASWIGTSVLVWGGNVGARTPDEVAEAAGEILENGASEFVAPHVAGRPPSTTFHSATPIDGGVLIAGGMEVAPIVGMSGGISTTASSQPLTVLSSHSGSIE